MFTYYFVLIYRERKKEELGYAEYRRIENERLKQYKVPMAELGKYLTMSNMFNPFNV